MVLVFGFLLVLLIAIFFVLKNKNIDIWIIPYLTQLINQKKISKKPVHIMFCYVDHYEPQWITDDISVERARVDRWMSEYPTLCKNHQDADGCYPKHTFFYPEEEYREEHLNKLADLCEQGYGEIEVHLHHDDDTSDNFRKTLSEFAQTLHNKHGVLSKFPDSGQIAYAFIHGNWCLDNSRKDGRWCGVNDELIILRETGCYADLTFPSAPSETQTSTINTIYYATDDPDKPKSHNTGVDVQVGGKASGDLMLIQGPLGLNWKKRKFGFIPKIEAGDMKTTIPPNKDRVDQWVKTGIHVKGRPEWVFVKIHTHGAQERDMDTLLGKQTDDMFSYLETQYNDTDNYQLHYVSSREMYNIIKAAEADCTGNPNDYRDYLLKPPTYRGNNAE